MDYTSLSKLWRNGQAWPAWTAADRQEASAWTTVILANAPAARCYLRGAYDIAVAIKDVLAL